MAYPQIGLALALLFSLVDPPTASALDTSATGPYARALRAHTLSTPALAGTEVDYEALRESDLWREVMSDLERTPPASLETRAQKLAFWINAYNIYAIDMVVQQGPVASIRDIGSFFRPVWNRTVGRIGDKARSLYEIENEILRPMDEPRLHGAIVCASLSCPPLRRTPYDAASLDAQLDEQMRRWLSDPRKGVNLDRENERLGLSRIFDWHARDFFEAGGTLRFIGPFLEPEDRAWLAQQGGDAKVYFLPYDWALNGVATAGNKN